MIFELLQLILYLDWNVCPVTWHVIVPDLSKSGQYLQLKLEQRFLLDFEETLEHDLLEEMVTLGFV